MSRSDALLIAADLRRMIDSLVQSPGLIGTDAFEEFVAALPSETLRRVFLTELADALEAAAREAKP